MKSPCCLCVCHSNFFFVFYAVRGAAEESWLLVLPRTSYRVYNRYLAGCSYPAGDVTATGRLVCHSHCGLRVNVLAEMTL
jgi:hypothetical protein